MVTRTSSRLPLLKGRVARVWRLDSCGRRVLGAYGQAVTEGVVTANIALNQNETDEVNSTNFSGKRRVYEPAVSEIASAGVDLTFTEVDFELFEILTGQTLVFDAFGAVVGMEVDTKKKLDDTAWALELWMGAQSTDACLDPNAQGVYGYLVLPFLKGGVLGDFTIENGAVNFSVTGASTRDNNTWGNGPVPVELGTGYSEVQTVTIGGAPAGGTFTLSYGGQTTAGIAYNAAASAVQSALQALSSVGAGNATVTGSAGGPYTVSFTGTLANQNVALITTNASGLTGGTSPTVAAAETTPGASSQPALLFQPLSTTAALRFERVTLTPPAEFVGTRPALSPTQGALGVVSFAKGATGYDANFTIAGGSSGSVWWEFGDGTWDYVPAPGATSHRYASTVSGSVTARATQDGRNWRTVTFTVPIP